MQQMFPCHKCGWQNVIGQRFCGNCAEVFQYNCPYCNIIVDPGYTSCPSCGAPLAWGFQQTVAEEQTVADYDQQYTQALQEPYQPVNEETFFEPPPQKESHKVADSDKLKQKKKNQLIVIIAFIGLVLCIGGAIYLGLQTFKSMNQEPPISAIDNHPIHYLYNPSNLITITI